jgi:Flp pilus assembly protein TadG
MPANDNELQVKEGHSARTSERGSSLVEVALVMIFVLVPLLLGAINFGRAFYASIEIANAARVAAQFGSQNTTDQQSTFVKTVAQNEAPDVSSSCGAGKTCWVSTYPLAEWGCECSNQSTFAGGTLSSNSCSCPSGHAVSFVRVTTKATYTPMFTFGGLFPAITLQSQVKIRFALS